MNIFKKGFSILLLALTTLAISSRAFAQDKRAVYKAYNQARELAQSGKYEQSITKFTQVKSQAQDLELQDIVDRVENKLPSVYYKFAIQKYKKFQKDKTMASLDATIDAFKETQKTADKYDNSDISDKTANVIKQLLYNKSLVQYNNKDYDAAIATLDKLTASDSTYAQAYYQKGIVMKKKNKSNFEEAIQYFDKAIAVAKKANKDQIARKATDAAYEQLLYVGSNEVENKDYSKGIDHLNKALEYNSNSPSAHYRLAEAYNKTQQYQSAISNAQKGLDLEKGGRSQKAKLYYELATAYQGIGKKNEACSAFDNAAYGSFKQSAEHQMEYVLKCKSATN